MALLVRSSRAELLASNLANADTSGYKARDFDFKEVLVAQTGARQMGGSMTKTNSRHLQSGGEQTFGAALQYREVSQPSMDGNTVDAQIEQAEFLDNAMRYEATPRFRGGRISGLRLAIKGE